MTDPRERFHLTLSTAGRAVMHGWWPDEATADRKWKRWRREFVDMPNVSVTLIDTADGRVIHRWPDEA